MNTKTWKLRELKELKEFQSITEIAAKKGGILVECALDNDLNVIIEDTEEKGLVICIEDPLNEYALFEFTVLPNGQINFLEEVDYITDQQNNVTLTNAKQIIRGI